MISISLKKNEAFFFACKVTGLTVQDFENYVIENIKKEFPTFGDFEDVNNSVEYFFSELGYTTEETMQIVFPDHQKNRELMQILDCIIFWGDAVFACSECGCEMGVEEIREGKHVWTNHICSNPYCDNALTNCPDIDTMKGGHDHKNS